MGSSHATWVSKARAEFLARARAIFMSGDLESMGGQA
jgi:hypothetical protein